MNNVNMWARLGLVVTVALGLASLDRPAAARPPCDGAGPCSDSPRREARQKEIAALHARVLKERVGLDDARAAEVQKVQASFRPQRQALRGEMRTTREAIHALVQANSADEAAYAKALAAAERLREQGHALEQAQRAAVGKLLSARERARLMVAMQALRKHRRGKGPAPAPEADDDGPELDD